MTGWRLVLEVARWEFKRFFKLRQQIVSLLLTVVLAAGGYAVGQWLNRSRGRTGAIAVLHAPDGFALPTTSGVRVVDRQDAGEAGLRRAVESGAIDGALLFGGPDSAVLVVRGTPAWTARLEAALNEWRQRQRFDAAGLQPAVLAALTAPVRLSVDRIGGSATAGRAARVSAFVIIALMILGIFVGIGFMFMGITGEKQARVTEQLLTAMPAEAWMDGKILGLTLVAAASVAGYVVSGLVLTWAARLAGVGVPLPAAFGAPWTIAVMVLMAVLGFVFWNDFMAGIAALVNDPQMSNRGGFMMLPVLPTLMALMGVGAPDTPPMRLLSMFPPTAPPVMLTRLVLGDVAWWELVVSVLLLVASIWALRVAAARIFRTSLLMYGKEATWSEVWRWVRAAD